MAKDNPSGEYRGGPGGQRHFLGAASYLALKALYEGFAVLVLFLIGEYGLHLLVGETFDLLLHLFDAETVVVV